MATHRNAMVEEVWDQNFSQGGNLLHVLRGYRLTLEDDSVSRNGGRNKYFGVKEAYSLLVNPNDTAFPKNCIWVDRVPTKIEFVYEDGKAVFQDGSSVHADTIFYCTEYKYHFPFIETNGIVTIDDDNRVGPLYKHVFPPHLAPWLSFIGMPKQDTPFLTTELQSKWLAHVLSGKVLLPTEEEMMSDVENYYHHMEETGVPKSFTHVLPPNEIEYRNWLLAQVEMPPLKEWRGRMYRECVKFANAKPDGYRDQWDDDYWDAVIASQEVNHLANGEDVGVEKMLGLLKM
ncbi:flavin-containing monooxygenase FMO GS-OX-like 2 [Vitis vinifera]|uniref:flavin-containing monooxygenase FMO GS-OX-like 2 n=1 Tax=Vitis vinifera TaxID=29760 RepID=UPI0028831182|nr:flavin-containing monooxygenase FMO GS-OX-like 2 [Vitis vinifera]